MDYDAIIIGSGVGGMTAGLLLRKEGMRVLVLEQAAELGGLLRVFRRGGCVFPTGVHCLGSLAPGQILWRYLRYAGVLDRVHLVQMDADGFEDYRFPDLDFRVPSDAGRFRQRLLERFPSERSAIDRFFADMRRVVGHFALYNLPGALEESPTELDVQPLQAYLDDLTSSAELKAILTAANPLYGVEPAACPLYVHFLVLDSMLNSAWRVAENRTPLADAFVAALKAAGVDARASARVVAVEQDAGAVRGVRLESGEAISGRLVVFTGHPRQLAELCGSGLRPAYVNRIAEMPETPGLFGVCLAWKNERSPFARSDVIVYNSLNTGRQYDQESVLSGGELPHMVYCHGSAEPSGGGYSVVGLCALSARELQPYWHTRLGARSPEYRAAKQGLAERIAARIAAMIAERWPESAADARIVDSFTSLTFRDYTLTPEGSAFGIKKQVNAVRSRIAAATRIKGLYLAGQNLVLPGVLGTVISSVDACGVILGRQYLVDKIVKETA